MEKITLGSKVQDKVTLVVGIATARSTDINGCIRYCIQPKGDGKTVPSPYWVDAKQVEFIKVTGLTVWED